MSNANSRQSGENRYTKRAPSAIMGIRIIRRREAKEAMLMKLMIPRRYLQFMHQIGLPFERVIERAGIANSLWKEELNVSEPEYARFVQELDRMITDEQIIALSDVTNVDMFRPTLFAALCANNGYDALHRFAEYEGIVVPIHVDIEETRNTVAVRYHLREMETRLPRVAVVNEQLLLLSLIRAGTGERIIPVSVQAPFQYGEILEKILGIPAEMAETDAIVFSLEDVHRPFLTENNLMWNFLEPELQKKQKESQTEIESFTALVQGKLLTALPAGKFDAPTIARSLGTSTRTFQRKLAEEGTTFAAQVRTIQELLTRSYLDRGDMTTAEIAFLVGYQDAGSLSRAFRNWTGMTMTEYLHK